jgi:hypothetical protein
MFTSIFPIAFRSTLNMSRYAAAVAAGVAFLGLAGPASAAPQERGVALAALAIAADRDSRAANVPPIRQATAALTSHSPWLAPVGHRQPRLADVPQDDVLSASEREQRTLDEELDRKLVICRGC